MTGGASEPASDREAWALLLAVTGIGAAGLGALLAQFGSGPGILAAARERGAARRFATVIDAVAGRVVDGAEVAASLVALARDPEPALHVLRATGLTILTLDDAGYPRRLRAIEEPPPVLLVRGEVAALSAEHTVAIVGTRRPTEHGRLIAARIAGAVCAAGGTVISGLAVGIDGAAHGAVVAEGGVTVAVLGSGHDRLFPRSHVTLAGRIVELGGAVISELWPEMSPSRFTFPRRNRVISALADATIVVEAGARSGALITARHALEQGRDLYLVPGAIDEPRSAGCLAWLREYPSEARIVATIPLLLDDLGLFRDDVEAGVQDGSGPQTRARAPSLAAVLVEVGPTAAAVGRALVAGRGTLDELVAVTGHPAATVLGAITLLELRGLATSTYGRYRAAGRLASLAPG